MVERKKVRLVVRVERDLYDNLMRYVQAHFISRNKLMTHLITDFLRLTQKSFIPKG